MLSNQLFIIHVHFRYELRKDVGPFNNSSDSSVSTDDENNNDEGWIDIESDKGSDKESSLESDQVEEEENYDLQGGVFETVAAEESNDNNTDEG